ncbi:FkbM family methyltransferase [Desulfosediminicola sp.]|uniref:FkbM family methyltransferase n=1 Tax=Desulfosediminicola sp. TaxID=2886825 RepID=UPI003AF25ABC
MSAKNSEESAVAETVLHFAREPGYLESTGWLRSMEGGEVVDCRGDPIPWLTYPAIEFLAPRLESEMEIFEYGSGNSTLWWSKRVKRVVSCEHDKEWYARYRRLVPDNVTYLLRRYKGGDSDYQEEILCYRDSFDILVLDGRKRVACMENGLGALRDRGVVIVDNSDREHYQSGYQIMAETGFKRLDFWGLGALSTRGWCTSFFYKNENCLGI